PPRGQRPRARSDTPCAGTGRSQSRPWEMDPRAASGSRTTHADDERLWEVGPSRLRYLGRYTHRVAISNHPLLAFDGEHVTFRWKDDAHGDAPRTMTLSVMEFLRRFVQHILPRGFVRIRQSGFLANPCRAARVALARTLLATPAAASSTGVTAPV